LFHESVPTPEVIDATGRFLGMLVELDLEEREATLRPGDTLVMFSDGVIDAVDPDGKPYGHDRLVTLLQARHDDSANALCGSIFQDVFAFRAEAPAFDDITVLIAKAVDGD
jgi:sigma-B regulation protein RsbU (phosphoserine phosphatase)